MQQNFFNNISFGLSIQRLPTTSFYVQNATIPGLSLGEAIQATPLRNVLKAGDRLEYEEFSVTCALDKDMSSWIDVYSWMKGLGFPDNTDEYKSLSETDDGLYSDISLILYNAKKNPLKSFTFKDAFPKSLSSIEMDVTKSNVETPIFTINFQYLGFDISNGS